jgi:hypothetical protein
LPAPSNKAERILNGMAKDKEFANAARETHQHRCHSVVDLCEGDSFVKCNVFFFTTQSLAQFARELEAATSPLFVRWWNEWEVRLKKSLGVEVGRISNKLAK